MSDWSLQFDGPKCPSIGDVAAFRFTNGCLMQGNVTRIIYNQPGRWKVEIMVVKVSDDASIGYKGECLMFEHTYLVPTF